MVFQPFTLNATVLDVNHPPVLDSASQQTTVLAGTPYYYAVLAQNPDADTLRTELERSE